MYSDTNTVSDVEYSDSNMDTFGLKYDRKIFVPFTSLLLTDKKNELLQNFSMGWDRSGPTTCRRTSS